MLKIAPIVTITSTKACSKCKVMKPVSEFRTARHHKDGLTSQCKSCMAAWQASHYQKDPRVKERNAAWTKANPEKRREWQRLDQQRNPEKWRKRRLKHTFGMTLEQYNEMFANQHGCCAICSRHQSEIKQTLCVDHNHLTGKIRKLLCTGCNHAVGSIREDIGAARALLNYLIEDQK